MIDRINNGIRTLTVTALLTTATATWAQSSSLLWTPPAASSHSTTARYAERHGQPAPTSRAQFDVVPPRDPEVRPMTQAVERVSLIAIPTKEPRKFKVHDLITIIVRQQKIYESEAKLDSEKSWNIQGKLSDWFRFYPNHRLGQDKLSNGEPGFQFDFDNKYETDGESEREDSFATRVGAKIIDVKPNGNLVLQARTTEKHDEERITFTLTGECRSEDVTPDNTILSTQIANLVLVNEHSGAIKDATTRGWVPRILDFAKPF
jgi:flagellar L-ring protein precursor FlgH